MIKRNPPIRRIPFYGGGRGIRTPVGLRPNGFQDRLVMTASITLRIFNSKWDSNPRGETPNGFQDRCSSTQSNSGGRFVCPVAVPEIFSSLLLAKFRPLPLRFARFLCHRQRSQASHSLYHLSRPMSSSFSQFVSIAYLHKFHQIYSVGRQKAVCTVLIYALFCAIMYPVKFCIFTKTEEST